MLTGDETVTSGEAYVGGHSILSELDQAQQNLGAYRIWSGQIRVTDPKWSDDMEVARSCYSTNYLDDPKP